MQCVHSLQPVLTISKRLLNETTSNIFRADIYLHCFTERPPDGGEQQLGAGGGGGLAGRGASRENQGSARRCFDPLIISFTYESLQVAPFLRPFGLMFGHIA